MNKKLIPAVLAVAVMIASTIACNDGPGVQKAGANVVNTVLFERTNIEQAIIDNVQNACRVDPVCASRQLP